MPGAASRERSGVSTRPGARPVLLDFGGTLAEPLVDMGPLVEQAAQHAGVRVPVERFLRESERLWRQLWPQAPTLLGQLPSFADIVHDRALRRARAQGPIDTMVRCLREEALAPRWHRPYPETEDVLRALRHRGHALYVLSNHTDYLPEILGNLGWSALFAGVTFSQEIGIAKPDPRLFALALDRASCSPADAVHVGDQWDADYVGARRAGIPALWLNRAGSAAPEECETVRDLRELRTRLAGPLGCVPSKRLPNRP